MILRSCAFVFLLAAPAAAQPSSEAANAQTTRLIPVSGALTVDGVPVTGGVSVTFSLHDAREGGSEWWNETQLLHADAGGRYTAYLGATSPLPQDAFAEEKARWLGVAVNGHAQPRVMLVAVPYALRAIDADTLGGKPAAAFVRTDERGRAVRADGTALAAAAVEGTGVPNQLTKWADATTIGSSIITESPANRLGIGTTDPSEGGLLQAKVTIRSPDTLTALAVANESGTPRWALNTYADGSIISFDRSSGSYLPGWVQRAGRVGISAIDPTGGGVVDAKLTVKNLDNNTGIAILNQFDARRFAVNTHANGGWLLYDGGNDAWNPGLFQRNGSVSIGTVAPFGNERLTVNAAANRALHASSNADFTVIGTATTSGGTAVLGENTGSGIGVYAFSFNGAALLVDGNGPTQAYFNGSGNVGIGTSGPADRLQVVGDIRVGVGTTGCVRDADATVIAGTCSSDRRLKRSIAPFASSLDSVARLQPVTFRWRHDEFPDRHLGASESFGLIAQDVEAVLPELVTTDGSGYKAVRYSALPLHMLQAIKELKAKNDELEGRLAAMEALLRRLQSNDATASK